MGMEWHSEGTRTQSERNMSHCYFDHLTDRPREDRVSPKLENGDLTPVATLSITETLEVQIGRTATGSLSHNTNLPHGIRYHAVCVSTVCREVLNSHSHKKNSSQKCSTRVLLCHSLFSLRSILTLHLFPVSIFLGFVYIPYDDQTRESNYVSSLSQNSHFSIRLACDLSPLFSLKLWLATVPANYPYYL